jgi:hypothetical protein
MIQTIISEAIVPLPSLAAHTHAFNTLAVGRGVVTAAMMVSACIHGAIWNFGPSLIALAFPGNAHPMISAMVGTSVNAAVKGSPAWVTGTNAFNAIASTVLRPTMIRTSVFGTILAGPAGITETEAVGAHAMSRTFV